MNPTEVPPGLAQMVTVDQETGCWLWTGCIQRQGYAQMGRTTRVHRLLYEVFVRPLTVNEALDHLCRVRHCVNPAHLEPVSWAENARRARSETDLGLGWRGYRHTHCKQGHELSADNIYEHRDKAGRLHRRCCACSGLKPRVLAAVSS